MSCAEEGEELIRDRSGSACMIPTRIHSRARLHCIGHLLTKVLAALEALGLKR